MNVVKLSDSNTFCNVQKMPTGYLFQNIRNCLIIWKSKITFLLKACSTQITSFIENE